MVQPSGSPAHEKTSLNRVSRVFNLSIWCTDKGHWDKSTSTAAGVEVGCWRVDCTVSTTWIASSGVNRATLVPWNNVMGPGLVFVTSIVTFPPWTVLRQCPSLMCLGVPYLLWGSMSPPEVALSTSKHPVTSRTDRPSTSVVESIATVSTLPPSWQGSCTGMLSPWLPT